MTTQGSYQAVVERIEDVRGDICTLGGKVDALTSSYQAFRERYAVSHEQVDAKANKAHERIDKIDKELDELKRLVQQQQQQWAVLSRDVRLLVGIVAFIGAGLGAWLIGQFTGLL